MARLTWDELTRREPRLKELLKEIEAEKDDKSKSAFCANRLWYRDGGYKVRMMALVGWSCTNLNKDPEMRTMKAYDTAMLKLYDALPDCRNCGCM